MRNHSQPNEAEKTKQKKYRLEKSSSLQRGYIYHVHKMNNNYLREGVLFSTG